MKRTQLLQRCFIQLNALKDWKEILFGGEDTPEAKEFKFFGMSLDYGDARKTIRTSLTVAGGLLIIGFIGVSIYGVFLWITAGDSEEQLQKAQKVLKGAVIGLVVGFGFIGVLGLLAVLLGVNIMDFSRLDELLQP